MKLKRIMPLIALVLAALRRAAAATERQKRKQAVGSTLIM